MCHIFRSNLPTEGNQLNSSSSSSSSLRKYQLSDFGIGTQFLHCLPLTSEELFTYSSLLSSLQMHLTGFFRRSNLFLSFACSIQLLAVHFLVVYGQLARVSVFGGTTLFGTLYARARVQSIESRKTTDQRSQPLFPFCLRRLSSIVMEKVFVYSYTFAHYYVSATSRNHQSSTTSTIVVKQVLLRV